MADDLKHDHNDDGLDRRGFLKCMSWAGTGLVWAAASGIMQSSPVGRVLAAGDPGIFGGKAAKPDFVFAQLSDSHIGFNKDANKDVTSTLMEAVRRVNALPVAPDFVIHTGDLTHLSKPEEFDTLNESLKSLKTSQVFFVPGEHDVLGDDGKQYLARYGKNTQGNGWFSFNHQGVHFVGLVNVLNLKAGGLGSLGATQLEWLEKDVKRLPSSTPIVVFAHMPLWSIYPEWGWGTDDGAQALGYLKRFGSVTVLNGHIHQTLQKIEGHVTFHTAASTAFPQPAPGSAPSPGPMTVPADRLRSVLGLTEVSFIRRTHALPIVDHRLTDDASAGDQMAGMAMPAASSSAIVVSDGPATITIDNFKFGTGTITVAAGTTVTWINRDDVPHTVVGTKKEFRSAALDTDQKFSFTFKTPGTYEYYCDVHPRMTGTVIVK
jgi:Icc protein